MARKSPQVEQIPEARRRSSGLVITALCVGFLALVATNWKEGQRFQSVNVTGVSELSKASVHSIVDSLVHKQIKSISLADVRMMVEKSPFVKSATVYVNNVRDLQVEVVERVPVAHVVLASGELRYVDADGTVLPVSTKRVAHNVPVLQFADGTELPEAQRKAAVSVINKAAQVLSQALYNNISEVRLGKSSNSIEFITTENNWCLGSVYRKNIAEALTDMNTFWENTLCKGLCSEVKEIDLRWSKHVIVRYHHPVVQQVMS